MSVTENLKIISNSLKNLSQFTDYDVEKYTTSLVYQTKAIEFFYCRIGNKKNYYLHNKPKVHQLAYINIGRGFPKELMDGHWCYILKDMGNKMLVIPTVSIKNTSINEEYEIDIDIIKNKKHQKSRLQLSDIRSIDIQRIYESKGYIKVTTSYNKIRNAIKSFI